MLYIKKDTTMQKLVDQKEYRRWSAGDVVITKSSPTTDKSTFEVHQVEQRESNILSLPYLGSFPFLKTAIHYGLMADRNSKGMGIHVFPDHEFQKIPKNINPAYGKFECFLVCKSSQEPKKYITMKIDPQKDPEANETVTQLGLFWILEDAINFAQTYRIKSVPSSKNILLATDSLCALHLPDELVGAWRNIYDVMVEKLDN